ncbi:hypothetical protein Aab01nite_53010 [Paractinoplanes abujensis]|uniref:DUF402 domain-containing protein n=1 Tax=Paractinoplanes abujensis TaxID=882441 RepID=A0A7W7CRZ6_9ACTN|nr:DUF402 domain-containing protein [Actinoplanes abujensis]MBB4693631.1 hypothetical protein [Actinoplanes abujensis]GID21711.1 hypothetical protein Aab01nite_53010 [Actinoplanes abujensis]
MSWAPGDTVLYRYGRDGRARFVRVGRVITDDADGLALWVAPGSPQIESVLADGRPLRAVPIAGRASLPRARRRSTWRGAGIVHFAPAAGEWSLWWFFDSAQRFTGWYGNLESSRTRWEADGVRGVDTADRALDVWITPDGAGRWKDEDEFAALTGRPGRWSAAQVPAIRAAGEQLMSLASAGAPPFDGRWTDYRPDPRWGAVTLPDNWDLPHRAAP